MKEKAARHGGDVFSAARELRLSWRDLLDFSANVNPLGPPPGLRKRLSEEFAITQHYPDPYAWQWRREIADRIGLSPDEVLAGNGTTALMYLLARALRPKSAVVVAPAFAEYERSLGQAGCKVRFVSCRWEDDLDITVDLADRVFALRPDLVYLGQPTSPAGRLIQPDILDHILGRARKEKIIVVLDEAFLDFTPAVSLAGSVRFNPGLIALRSLTKFYALPGLRLGYLTASRKLAGRLFECAEPWAVNSLALIAGSFCLDQDDYARRTRRLVDRERAWLADRLREIGLGRVVDSSANYILVKLDSKSPAEEELVTALKKHGLLIRGCSSFQNLAGFIRLAVKTRSSNLRLFEALKSVLKNQSAGEAGQ
ncbi:MAG: threonine-phosphate decarboxylase CobD [Thermodesulfobacteriota bacterium]